MYGQATTARSSSRLRCETRGSGICTAPPDSSRMCVWSPSRTSTSRSWPRRTWRFQRTSRNYRHTQFSAEGRMFGLPDGVSACLFDMVGVVTKTATLHAAAWKEMFDEFLRGYGQRTGTEFVPFDPHHEYDAYVDGKPRLDGTRSFL